MILFNENIVQILKKYLFNDNEFIESILLSSYGFGIQFCGVNIHCNERVFARINGSVYEWGDAPSSAPWGILGRQKAVDVLLPNPSRLRITLESGDYIEIETVEGQYESVVINLPSSSDSLIMEIY